MAYVHPTASGDLVEALQRNAKRAVAVAAYGSAFVVAVVILSPLLFKGSSGAATPIPAGPAPVLYTVQPGDTPPAVAATHGLSLAELYSLNPSLTPFATAKGTRIVVGLS